MEALLKYASTSMTNPGKVAVLHRNLDLEARWRSDSVIEQSFRGTAAVHLLHKNAGLHNPSEFW